MNDFLPASPGQEAELERLQAKFGDGSHEAHELVAHAHGLHCEIVQRCAAIRAAWTDLARFLHEFMEERGWEVLGYDSENAYLADPEIGLSRSHARRLLRVYRSVVVERAVPAQELEGVELTKLDVAIPAIRAGQVRVDEAIADTRELGWRDLRERYRGDPNAPIDPATERVPCPTCGRMADPDQLQQRGATG